MVSGFGDNKSLQGTDRKSIGYRNPLIQSQ